MVQDFVQKLNEAISASLSGVHTSAPGIITAFDADTCLATVQPKLQFKAPDGRIIQYPKISGVPVVMPQSNTGCSIAFPVTPGDGCLIIFAEQSLDYWMYGQETDTDLKFDLSNAVCIPGLFHFNPALRAACKSGSVVVKAPLIEINGDVTINGSLTTKGGTVNLN